MNISLAGKTALVTGASRGIGRAIAIALAEAGANVMFTYNSSPKDAEETAAAITAHGQNTQAIKVDISDETAITSLFKGFDESNIAIDILVNNAGIIMEKSTVESSASDFDHVIGINLRGTFLTGREALKRMVMRGQGGRIINISSDLGFLGRESFALYAASKGAINALTKSWALEYAPHILVNGIAPGPVDTDMLDINNMTPEWREKEEQIPMERIGQPEEISGMAVYLASEYSSFVTGQIFGVNGGSVMP
jgi:3-oxoacyl-[acyl-carrier protein] reductase